MRLIEFTLMQLDRHVLAALWLGVPVAWFVGDYLLIRYFTRKG